MQKREQNHFWHSFLAVAVCCSFLLTFFLWIPSGSAEAPFVLPAVDGVPQLSGGELRDNRTFLYFVQTDLIPVIKIILEAVAIAYMIYYGAHMALSLGNEESVKKDRTVLIYAAMGFIILNLGEIFVKIFNPVENAGEPGVFEWGLLIGSIINALRYLAGILGVAWLIISGFRMVTAAGKEEVITKQRTQIIWTVMGLIFIAMAGNFVDIAFNAKTTEGISLFNSLTNLLLLFTVPLGFLFLVLGGMYMITAAGNDARLTKGKKILQATIIAMVIIYSAYTLLTEILKFSNW